MYRVRPAKRVDLPVLYSIHRRAMYSYVDTVWGWDEEYQSKRFEDYFSNNNLDIIIVDRHDVGFIHVEKSSSAIKIVNVEIDPTYQGHGIGTAVIRDLVAAGVAEDVDVELQVLHVNDRAKRLYERLGFTVYDTTPTHNLMRHRSRP